MKEEQKMAEWKTIEPGIWKPEQKGDSIEGVLVHKEIADKVKSMSAKYRLDVGNNEFMLVWGSTVMDDRMQLVKEGQKVRITFEGKVKNLKKQDVNIYKVEVAMD